LATKGGATTRGASAPDMLVLHENVKNAICKQHAYILYNLTNTYRVIAAGEIEIAATFY